MDIPIDTLTVHLMFDWLKMLQEDCHEEAMQQNNRPVKLIKGESRVAVWTMCEHLGFKKQGLPGQACRLLERYMFIKINRDYRELNHEEWAEYTENLMMKMPLLIATCVQLVAKMSNTSVDLKGSIIREKLLCKGISFTVDEVIASEIEVYSTIGFRIPLWTSVDIAYLLSFEGGVPPEKLDTVAAIVNFAEFRRDYIEEKVLHTPNLLPSTYKSNTVRLLHLSAGAVLSAGRLLHLEVESELGIRLSFLSRAPLAYINCISDLIFTIILSNDDDSPPKRPTKRKMPL